MTNKEKALALISTFASGDTRVAASLLAEGYIQHNLSYGTYLFRVKAMDGFDRVSPEKTFTFIIEKPYYLRWYSLLSYLLVLAGLISLYAKWRNRKLLIEKLRLEQLVEQRTEQIRSQRDEIAEKSQKLETALAELKEAQDQLIQQEKVATVGKLTQGLIDRILNGQD